MMNKLASEPQNGETSSEDMNRRVREIVFSLFQMEKETRSFGLKFSALLLRAAALSFSNEFNSADEEKNQ